MKFVVDQDFHIHSYLSLCSDDPRQNKDTILQYAVDNGLKKIILTDHHWDETVPKTCPFDFYDRQDYAHILAAKPLPQADGVEFLFGCETDLDKEMRVGVAPEHYDRFAFVIIPTTHLHMDGFTLNAEDDTLTRRAELWVSRFDGVLDMDLPFHKIGIAHLTCSLMAPRKPEDHLKVLDSIGDDVMKELFAKSAEKGVGIELNFPLYRYPEEVRESILRPYRIAKECGNKFYFGSDAHSPEERENVVPMFREIVDLLDLQEEDKFILR